MSSFSNWLHRIPNWVWFSCIPTFGGFAIVYAGNKTKTPAWIWLGLGFFGVSLIVSSSGLMPYIWFAQIGTAFYLKKRFLLKTAPRGFAIPDRETAQFFAETKGKIDINACSKDQLVYDLGLPIVYANDIEAVLNEGYLFTHLEELSEIAGLPENYLRKLEPLITFGYDLNKEADVSWRCLNTASQKELLSYGIGEDIAQKLVEERQKNGSYRSLIEVKRRTGLPLSYYSHLRYGGIAIEPNDKMGS